MKVLLGPLPKTAWTSLAEDRGHSVRTFGYQQDTDFAIDYRTEGIPDLFAKLPPDWFPDLLIDWSPVYYPFPPRIEECPVPTAAIVGDWHNAFSSMRENLKRFDLILTDKKGCEVFKRCGFDKVEYYPMYSFDPALHRKNPGCEKVYDLVFGGYHEGYLPGRRVDFLGRLARMDDKYRIKILSGVHGERYTRLLNEAKIGFNLSVRGEMNMRAYEVPACGTMLFMEEDNLEVGDFLEPGKECVLYNQSNFEELIEKYINEDDLREEIAEAGHRRIQSETHDKHFADLLDRLSDLRSDLGTSTQRAFRQQSAEVQSYSTARYYAFHPLMGETVGIRRLGETLRISESASACEAMALFHVRLSRKVQEDAKREELLGKAEEFFRRALEGDPEDNLLKASYGEFLLDLAREAAEKGDLMESARRLEKSRSFLEEAISGLSKEPEEVDLRREIYPHPTDPFRIELESCLARGEDEARRVFLGRLWLLRGRVERLDTAGNDEEALRCVSKASELWENSRQCHLELAELLGARGDWKESAMVLENAVRLAPLNLDLLKTMARARSKAGEQDKSEEVKGLIRRIEERRTAP